MWIAILLEVGLLGLLIGVDLFSKSVIMPFLLQNNRHYELIEDVLGLTYAENYGASFGVFTGNKVLLLSVTSIAIILMLALLVYFNQKPKLLRYGLITIIGGAIGNLVDRISLGYVRDFIDYEFLYSWFGINFAIGNIADIFCLVGVLMIIVYVFFEYKEGDLESRFKRFRKC